MSSILFRSRIALSSQTRGICYTALLKFSCCTKVNKHDFSIWSQHNIGGLHIPVNNRWFSGMKIRQYITKLFCPFNNICLVLGSIFPDNTFQMTSFYVVHDNQEASVSVNDIDNAWQVWVIQFFQQISFHYKALFYHLKILNTVFSYLFNRPLFIGSFIHGKVNHTHTALPDFI